jgi:hypothetical protein
MFVKIVITSCIILSGCANMGPTVRESVAYQQQLIDQWNSNPQPNRVSPQMVEYLRQTAYPIKIRHK